MQVFSIHAPHAGRDPRTSSVEGLFWVSIHAPHAGRDIESDLANLIEMRVSIHARAHAGRDGSALTNDIWLKSFNPRAPRGARPPGVSPPQPAAVFQSTRPTRGATLIFCLPPGQFQFQSTRPTRGATDLALLDSILQRQFQSTRPTRGGAADVVRVAGVGDPRFNPRAPRGARLGVNMMVLRGLCFNPRAPRGARRLWTARLARLRCFNPRAPRGARRQGRDQSRVVNLFQSTRPTRGATCGSVGLRTASEITGFQSTRSPTRGATPATSISASIRCCGVSIHAPTRGATTAYRVRYFKRPVDHHVSIHAPHAGRDDQSSRH